MKAFILFCIPALRLLPQSIPPDRPAAIERSTLLHCVIGTFPTTRGVSLLFVRFLLASAGVFLYTGIGKRKKEMFP